MPKAKATVQTTIVSQLEVQGGYYCFTLPQDFYPNYTKYGCEAGAYDYEFNFETLISSLAPISNLSIPDGAEAEVQDAERTKILVKGS